ncbi:MAG: alpha-E domain-containing protein [Gemmatimonadales bacterium]|nr:alpha-E domain-containing protein [Gemmatimonadales bacterium]
MISRVAQSCFWLHRYMERAEATARLLQVTQHVSLDVELPEAALWQPVLEVSGEARRYGEAYGDTLESEAVQAFLTWDEANPVSLLASLHRARENARTIRETISLETWQSLNSLWLWLASRDARRLYQRERHAFYERVKAGCQLYHGLYHTTMLFDEPYDFMRLGSLMERADQTIRILRATWRAVEGRRKREDHPTDGARWLAALRACTGVEAFAKRSRGTLVGPVVADFLLHDDRFPRAVLHCLLRAELFLDRARGGEGSEAGEASRALLSALVARLRGESIETLVARGLPAELELLLAAHAELGAALHHDFFDLPVLPAGA